MGRVLPTLRKQGSPLASGAAQRDLLARTPLPRSFADALRSAGLYPLRPTQIEILQINVGKRCNQTCRHCHVDAGPDRTERSEEHTSELQSRLHLVCRLLLEKKKKTR